MSEPKTPREGCAWTEERVKQFETLERLLGAVSELNHSTDFIGNVKECIELADQLLERDFDSSPPNFTSFLEDQIIKDRSPEEPK